MKTEFEIRNRLASLEIIAKADTTNQFIGLKQTIQQLKWVLDEDG